MKKDIGLWIDHRKAVVVIVTKEGEEVRNIPSALNKRIGFSKGASETDSAEDVRDRRVENHLDSYYDDVIAVISGGDSIRIFGPGEAKGELKKRLEGKNLARRILSVETVDKMTDRQIAAKVRGNLSHK